MFTLTPTQAAHADRVARARRHYNGSVRASGKRDGQRTDLEIDMLGAECEVGARVYFALDFVDGMVLRDRDPGYDFVVNGWTVDVKGIAKPEHTLLFPNGFRADLAVLVYRPEPGVVDVVGWIDQGLFSRYRFTKNIKGLPDAVERCRVVPIEKIWALLLVPKPEKEGCQSCKN